MKEESKVILAALLHDIGKFWQCTDETLTFSDFDQQLYCPKSSGGYYTHKHVLYTDKFIHRYLKDDELAQLAASHHNPENEEHLIIQLADWLSSGERFEGPVQTDEFYATPLMSVFSNLFREEREPYEQAMYFPLSEIRLEKENFFPKEKYELTQDSYTRLWKEFINELNILLEISDIKYDLQTWYYLLKKYLSRIPAARPTEIRSYVPDVSLFDHSRTTAAFVACLTEMELSVEKLKKVLSDLRNADQKDFLFIGGDISGVQDFIYSITSKGAAKGLKGRSYYLQLLEKTVSNYLLDHLNLPRLNRIYSGGGHFYILAPAIYEEELKDIEIRINQKMLGIHNGDLGVVLGWRKAAYKDFLQENFSPKWGELTRKVEKRKRQKFRKLIENDPSSLLQFRDRGGDVDQCSICKREAKIDDEGKCNFCKSLEKLGESIARADVKLETQVEELKGEPDNYQEAFQMFGFEYKFLEDVSNLDIGRDESSNLHLLNTANLKQLIPNLPSILKEGKLGKTVSLGFEFVGQVTPFKDGKIKDFDQLVEDSTGINRLGVLRADVDDLGHTFRKGLKKKMTLSRMASLSSSLSLFFEGWINHYLDSQQKYKDKIYLIYSGGDDLFLVGAWDVVMDASYGIWNYFTDFTKKTGNGSKSLTLSAGIALIPAKYPIYKGAEIAGSFEDLSKAYERKGENKNKNAVTVLGNTVGWEGFAKYKEIKDVICEKIDPERVEKVELPCWIKEDQMKKMTKSDLGKLSRIYQLYVNDKEALAKESLTKEEREEMVKFQRWRWRLIYLMKKEHPKLLDRILKEDMIENLDLAVRWADLLLR